MTSIGLLTLLGVFAASVHAWADGGNAPLAVTAEARPTADATPTLEAQELSDKYLRAGLGYLRNGLPERAIQEFNDSVRLAPSADNYKALGTAFYQTNNNPKAVWAYRESLQLRADPKVQALADDVRVSILLDQADAEAKGGQVEDAIRDYMGAFAIKPEDESAEPCLRLAADAVEDELGRGALAQAIEILYEVSPASRSKDLGRLSLDHVARLRKASGSVELRSGRTLDENVKAMLADRDAWERSLAGVQGVPTAPGGR